MAAAHTGETRSDLGSSGDFNLAPGSIILSGASGAALATAAFHVTKGTLTLDDSVAFAGGATGRIGDSTPVDLSGGTLTLTGNATTTSAETIGALKVAGFSTVSLTPSAAAGAQLTAASLERVDGGTVVFRGTNLGKAPGSGVANAFFDTPPEGLIGNGGAGPNLKILPYAVGSSASSSFTGLVTYDDATGVRLLDLNTEYVRTLAGVAPTNNVMIVASETNNAALTVNSLVIQNGPLRGTGKITISSGALLDRVNNLNSATSNEFDFGAAEGHVFVSGGLTLNGLVHGSGGLTKSGPGDLTLNAANPFSGTLRINSGAVAFSSVASLGVSADPIVIAGPDAGLKYTGFADLTFGRGIEVHRGIALLQKVASSASLEFSGPISGDGGVRLSGVGLKLTGANSYRGPTVVEGTLVLNSDAALGSGPLVLHGGIRLEAPWATSRGIEVAFPSSISTNGFDATWNGALVGNGGKLTKLDVGTLTIGARTTYDGNFTIDGGAIRLAGQGAARAASIGGIGSLVLDNSGAVVTDRLPDTMTYTAAGTLSFIGSSAARISEALGTLRVENATAPAAIVLTAPGPHLATLQLRVLLARRGQRGFSWGEFRSRTDRRFYTSHVSHGSLAGVGLLPGALVDRWPAREWQFFCDLRHERRGWRDRRSRAAGRRLRDRPDPQSCERRHHSDDGERARERWHRCDRRKQCDQQPHAHGRCDAHAHQRPKVECRRGGRAHEGRCERCDRWRRPRLQQWAGAIFVRWKSARREHARHTGRGG